MLTFSSKVDVALTCLVSFIYFSSINTCYSQSCYTENKVLLYEPTYQSYYETYLETLGYTVEVADETEWLSKSALDFSKYNAIIFGDCNCGSESIVDTAVTNRDTWSSVINGNIVILGTDEYGHSATDVIQNGLEFVLEDTCYKTGLYVSLSEFYESASTPEVVELLEYFGDFYALQALDCYDDAHIVAVHEMLEDMTDDSLSNWGCSVHEIFTDYPFDFVPLVIANNYVNEYTVYFGDGSYGIPYVLAKGSSLDSVYCEQNTTTNCDNLDCRYEYNSIEVSPNEGSMLGGETVFVTGPCFDTVSDWYCVFGTHKVELTRLNTSVGTCETPSMENFGYVPFGIMSNNEWYSNSLLITLFYFNNIILTSDNGISFDITTNYTVSNYFNNIQDKSPLNNDFYSIVDGNGDDITINWDNNDFINEGIEYIDIYLIQLMTNDDYEEDNSTNGTSLYELYIIDIIVTNIEIDVNTASQSYLIENLNVEDKLIQQLTDENEVLYEIMFLIVDYDAELQVAIADSLGNTETSTARRRLGFWGGAAKWVFSKLWKVTKLTSVTTLIVSQFVDPCDVWAKIDVLLHPDTDEWLNSLPDCPDTYPFENSNNRVCTISGWTKDQSCTDGSSGCDTFHTGAENCIRHPSGQQCCYTSNHQLCTTGFCAGTPDRTSTSDSIVGHFTNDVVSFLMCCVDTIYPLTLDMDSGCQKYMELRKPNQGGGEDPICAIVNGDPHINTFDLYFYTFNGIGEYYLIYNEYVDISVSLESINQNNNNNNNSSNNGNCDIDGSVVNGFGINDKISDKIWVLTSGDGTSGIKLYENGNEMLIPSNYSDVTLEFPGFSINYEYTYVKITFTNIDITLQLWLVEMNNTILNNNEPLNYFDYTIDLSNDIINFTGNIQGLMGNFDGNPDNDIQFRYTDTDTNTDTSTTGAPGNAGSNSPNSTDIDSNTNTGSGSNSYTNIDASDVTDSIIYEFGESWKIDPLYSIINNINYGTILEIENIYCPNKTFEIDFTFCINFLNNSNYEQDINTLCNDNYQCLFDASVTCDTQFANQTLVFATIAEDTIKYLLNPTATTTMEPNTNNSEDEGFEIPHIVVILLIILGIVLILCLMIYFVMKFINQNGKKELVHTTSNKNEKTMDGILKI